MRVAISGGIGEGKSTVLAMIEGLGRSVASSDEIARKVLEEEETQRLVCIALGYSNPPTRESLRSRIATDPGARRALNAVTHPRIVQAIRVHSAQFVEVPLLLEACLYGMFDRVWIITSGREAQIERLHERYGNRERALELIATQLPTEAKLAFADEVVRTNQSLQNVSEVVAGLVAAIPAG